MVKGITQIRRYIDNLTPAASSKVRISGNDKLLVTINSIESSAITVSKSIDFPKTASDRSVKSMVYQLTSVWKSCTN